MIGKSKAKKIRRRENGSRGKKRIEKEIEKVDLIVCRIDNDTMNR